MTLEDYKKWLRCYIDLATQGIYSTDVAIDLLEEAYRKLAEVDVIRTTQHENQTLKNPNIMSTKREIVEYFKDKFNGHDSRIEKIEESLRLLKQENEKEFAKQSDMDALKKHAEGLANRIALLEFKIDNPQQYTKGLKIGDDVVSEVWIKEDIRFSRPTSTELLFLPVTSSLIRSEKTYYWSYELTNTKTGDKTTCSEYTLTQLIEAREKADAEKKTTKKR